VIAELLFFQAEQALLSFDYRHVHILHCILASNLAAPEQKKKMVVVALSSPAKPLQRRQEREEP
jgi:hypothetical protein